jgi:pimeloyl-ACP methyl ester carboxylesterase
MPTVALGGILAGVQPAVDEPIRDGRVRLRDGRALAYAEWGALHGPPVFFFHGSPLSRLWCPDEAATREAGVRLVAVDRPGFGRSDLYPGRRLADWPLDVAELADALDLDRFAVAGYSAGGPYALACAALLGDRVSRAGLVATTTRFVLNERPSAIAELDGDERREFELVEQGDRERAAQSFAAELTEWTRVVAEDPQRFFDPLPANDQNRWWREDPARTGPFLRAIGEALRQGAAGLAWERVVSFESFPVALESISVDVLLWHGELDVLAPCEPAKFLASRIPTCRATIWPDEGHIGMARHWGEILTALTR